MWIATRTLTTRERKPRTVRVRIGVPKPESKTTWACPFQVSGPGSRKPRVQVARGIDSLQALSLAFEGLRVALRNLDVEVSWAGAELGHGIPYGIPSFYGPQFEAKCIAGVEKAVKAEGLRLSAQGKRRLRSKK